jgi:hypothetical protein
LNEHQVLELKSSNSLLIRKGEVPMKAFERYISNCHSSVSSGRTKLSALSDTELDAAKAPTLAEKKCRYVIFSVPTNWF